MSLVVFVCALFSILNISKFKATLSSTSIHWYGSDIFFTIHLWMRQDAKCVCVYVTWIVKWLSRCRQIVIHLIRVDPLWCQFSTSLVWRLKMKTCHTWRVNIYLELTQLSTFHLKLHSAAAAASAARQSAFSPWISLSLSRELFSPAIFIHCDFGRRSTGTYNTSVFKFQHKLSANKIKSIFRYMFIFCGKIQITYQSVG